MAMTGFIFQDKYLVRLEKLSDQEVGRLVRALSKYHATGETQELKGRECGYYDFIKADIDEVENAYATKCEKNKKNRQGTSTNVYDRQRTSTTVNERPQNININIKEKEEEDKEDTRTREDMPFGLTDDDIQASIDRRQQLEDAARSIGLQVTEAGMMYGERLVQEYGLEKVLDAIKKAVDVPKWAYVEGICKGKGVKPNDNHGDHGTDSAGTRRGKYSFLFDGTEAV